MLAPSSVRFNSSFARYRLIFQSFRLACLRILEALRFVEYRVRGIDRRTILVRLAFNVSPRTLVTSIACVTVGLASLKTEMGAEGRILELLLKGYSGTLKIILIPLR